jgi:hypothetical protein
MHDIAVYGLALLVEQLQPDFLAQVEERCRRMTLVEPLCGVGPGDEVKILRHAPFQRDRLILGSAQTFENDVETAFLVIDHVGGAFQRGDFADGGNRSGAGTKVDQEAI